VGHFWRFAGLDPTSKWEKGKKRPWNASLKVLCWKAGESFVKVKGNQSDVYGQVYEGRKAYEQARNDDFQYKDQAELAMKRVGKDTEAYKWYAKGMLPPGHIHARAKRYAVKLMMSHLHHVMHLAHFGTPPPKPYILVHGNDEHVHFTEPPNLHVIMDYIAQHNTPTIAVG
jgi:hypothetical protein